MLNNGFESEVSNLLRVGYNLKHKSMRSIGYSHMVKYLDGDYTYEEMIELLTRDTRRYAKRQLTWFNKIKDIKWINTNETSSVSELVETFIQCTL